MKANDIRKQFKEIGYKVGLKQNPFKDTLLSIVFKDTPGLNGNVFSGATYEAHKEALELKSKLSGTVLDNGDKIA